MSWSSTTLSTVSSIAKWENEILQLTSAGTTSYFADGLDIASDTVPLSANSVDVSTGKGVLEIIGKISREIIIKQDTEFSIKFQHSDDDSTFSDIHTGARQYYLKPASDTTITVDTELFRFVVPSDCKDYIKPYITSSVNHSGGIDIYVVAKWQDKIDAAKDILGTDVSLRLMSTGYDVDEANDEVLLDLINNPTIFSTASDFLTIALIYEDLSMGDEDSIYYKKMELYRRRYESALEKASKLIDIDLNFDGTTDYYKQNLEQDSRIIR